MKRDEALKTLGRRIAALRREKGLTQEALAEAMGVSRNHVADIELGARNTGVWSLLLICRALKIPPAEMFADFRFPEPRRDRKELPPREKGKR